MMKHIIRIIICILFSTNSMAFAAATYYISDFESLINHFPPLQDGDSVYFSKDILATSDIGQIINGQITLDGQLHSLDGANAFSGFDIKNADSYILKLFDDSTSNGAIKNFKSGDDGGAIKNSGALTIENSIFYANNSDKKGGAIYNANNLDVKNSSFTLNKAMLGGAIYNNNTVATNILNTIFDSNTSYQDGGALHYTSTNVLTLDNANFENNVAKNNGGAIYSDKQIVINKSNFNNNTSENNGGAMYHKNSTMTISDTDFLNNSATNSGGAIFNDGGIITINSENKPVTFKDNIANAVPCDIFMQNIAELNFNAQIADIILNGGISSVSSSTSNMINVNPLGNQGRIILNNAISGLEGADNQLNLFGGTLKLGNYTNSSGNTYYGSIGNATAPIYSFNILGNSTLDMANGRANDSVYTHNFEINDTLKILTDVDLENQNADKINVSGAITKGAAWNLDYTSIKMLSDKSTDGAVTVLSGNVAAPLNITTANTYTNNYKYEVTNLNDGTLNFTPFSTVLGAPVRGLHDALNDNSAFSFSLIGDYDVSIGTYDLPGLAGNREFTIFGQDKKYSITGAYNYKMLTVADGSKLNIYDTVIEKSNAVQAAILNAGDLNLYNCELTLNNAGAVQNTNGNINVYDTFFNSNTKSGNGAAINSNLTSSGKAMNIFNSKFYANVATSGDGGAIYNNMALKLYNTDFEKNVATAGGAIYNNDEMSIEGANFTENRGNLGGAIYNNLKTINIKNSNFTKNIAGNVGSTDGKGGAIYSAGGKVNLLSDGADMKFSENKAGERKNAIHLNAAELNINTGKGTITFDDSITSEGSANKININSTTSTSATTPNYGTVIINSDMSNFGAGGTSNTVNLEGGTLALTNNASFFNNIDFSMKNNATLNLANNSFDTINLQSFNIDGTSNLFLDVDLLNQQGDFISAGTSSGGGTLMIRGLNLLSDAAKSNISIIDVSSDTSLANKVTLHSSASTVLSPMYKYDVNFNATSGQLNFINSRNYNGYNPAIFAGAVAAQVGSYLNQLNAYEEAFGNMDMVMIMPKALRWAMKLKNKYAAVGNDDDPMVFSPTYIPEEDKGAWFRPYTTFETVPLQDGPTVGNVSYGSLFGTDSKIYELKHGFDAIYTGYIGYNGSHQTYDGVGIYQNGGLLGATAAFYKGNFFSALTANVGANQGRASSISANDNFTMLTAGAASKTGYNFEFGEGKFIIQPSFLISYTFVNTYDYKSASGVQIESDPLNAIQIAPGIKFIGNLKNGWQPYAGVTMVWNIIDKTRFKANNVALPDLSIKPYIQYGVGLQKRWGERLTVFGQTMVRNAGRNGVSLLFGLRWTI